MPLHIPPVCQAVIQQDIHTLEQQLVSHPEKRHARDPHGFTALELCQLLGFTEGARLLSNGQQERIKIFPKNGTHSIKLTSIEFEKHFRISHFSSLRFKNYQDLCDTLKHVPLLLSHLLKKNAQLIHNPFKINLDLKVHPSLMIKWIDPLIGHGVYTTAPLQENTILGEYTGMVRRLLRRQPNPNAYCVHYPTRYFSWNYTVIDASEGGNLLRFVNHSDTPNLKPLWVMDRHLLHLVFITLFPILSNSELTINYGEDYWIKRTKLISN
ncbi:SET domain-containing protein-lysine N-methyltransferase [Parachlamydia sp.]|uniref:SET domain-containing protein-lysine N-methyltransferase n=1 Tax=Parachlamydia sp. TaxID=2052048 RepID=UPI003D127197